MRARAQLQASLFPQDPPALPSGMRYADDLISATDEQALARHIAALPLKPFEFVGGLRGNRRVASFGWRYDFNSHQLDEAADIPDFLLALRQQAAAFAGMQPARFQQVLVTEYAPGAGIGWHRDRPMFGEVVGISLLAPCPFRMRRKVGTTWERMSLVAQPRSAYLLAGPSRDEWEHSIPPMRELRYSVTFRNFREAR